MDKAVKEAEPDPRDKLVQELRKQLAEVERECAALRARIQAVALVIRP